MGEDFPQEFGQYTLHELIGRGGMAEIYRATMPGIGGFEKTVAIKKILPHLAEDEEFTSMLIDEARIIESLDHSNIAQVFDLGKREGTYYIAMEYIHGVDLAEMIDELEEGGEYIPVPHVIHIISSVCAGLDFAHSKTDENGEPLNVIHRDISPHNIRLSFAGEVKIIDFGVAKAADREAHTKMGVIKGKLLYMAPEQAKAEDLDGRADLFATGLCAYKMLTGELPFEGENEFQVYNNILQQDIVPPKKFRPEIPEELDRIVMKLLERDREERYQEGYTVKQELDQLLHEAAPGYTVNRLSRFVEENFSHLVQEGAEPEHKTQTSKPSDLPPSTPPPGKQKTGERGANQLESGAASAEEVEQPVAAGADEAPATVTATPDGLDDQSPSANDGGQPRRTETSSDETTGQFAPEEPKNEGSRIPGVVYTIIGLLVAIFGMLCYSIYVQNWSTEPGGGSEPPPKTDREADPSSSAASDGPSGMVSIDIDTDPEGATLLRKGSSVGHTPASFALPADDEAIRMTISKEGYSDKTIALTPNEDFETTIELTAADASPDAGAAASSADTGAAEPETPPADQSADDGDGSEAPDGAESGTDESGSNPDPDPLQPPSDDDSSDSTDRGDSDEPAPSNSAGSDDAPSDDSRETEPPTSETDSPTTSDDSAPADDSPSSGTESSDEGSSDDDSSMGGFPSESDSEESTEQPDEESKDKEEIIDPF